MEGHLPTRRDIIQGEIGWNRQEGFFHCHLQSLECPSLGEPKNDAASISSYRAKLKTFLFHELVKLTEGEATGPDSHSLPFCWYFKYCCLVEFMEISISGLHTYMYTHVQRFHFMQLMKWAVAHECQTDFFPILFVFFFLLQQNNIATPLEWCLSKRIVMCKYVRKETAGGDQTVI